AGGATRSLPAAPGWGGRMAASDSAIDGGPGDSGAPSASGALALASGAVVPFLGTPAAAAPSAFGTTITCRGSPYTSTSTVRAITSAAVQRCPAVISL